MTQEYKRELREVKARLKQAAKDLSAAYRVNAKALQRIARQRKIAERTFARAEAVLHRDNRLAEAEHTKTTKALARRQATLQGRIAS